jgi:hypothetical protein
MHVLHNVPFYSELMRHFLELCCNRVPVDAEAGGGVILNHRHSTDAQPLNSVCAYV